MVSQTMILASSVETRGGTLRVLQTRYARVVVKKEALSTFPYFISNALVGNSLGSRAIEVREYLELENGSEAIGLGAVTGEAEVRINDREGRPWSAFPLPPGAKLRVVATGGPAYVAFYGLQAPTSTLSKGTTLTMREPERFNDLHARYVPENLLKEYAKRNDVNGRFLYKVIRHLELACEMARRGAKLLRVKMGSHVYDVWIEELG